MLPLIKWFALIEKKKRWSDLYNSKPSDWILRSYKCYVTAEPHHGEMWQIVAKDMKNVGKNIEEILKLVSNVLS